MDLDKLAEQDPEFYEYLKKNDPELLAFTTNGEEDEDGEDDDDGDSEDAERRKLNKSTIRQWQKAIIEVSTRLCPIEATPMFCSSTDLSKLYGNC